MEKYFDVVEDFIKEETRQAKTEDDFFEILFSLATAFNHYSSIIENSSDKENIKKFRMVKHEPHTKEC